MKIIRSAGLLSLLIFWVWGCTVVSQEVKDEALPPLPLPVLISDVEKYLGDTVVVGGHVVAVENKADHSEIVAVQSPLGVGQRPGTKDLSEGRLVIIYNGFIDPEVYTKDRKITVGGKIVGSSAQEEKPPFPFLKIEVRDLHLWAAEDPKDPYWYDYYPYNYPWWWHHHFYHRHRHYRHWHP
jgi:outer membrane lipoprotein